MRILKLILLGVLGAVVLLSVFVFVVEPVRWHWQARRDSVSALSAARSTNDLEQAVGDGGIFVPLKDGSWIAVLYEDTHAFHIDSLAIARDSGGRWFESDRHFCGAFCNYKLEEGVRTELARIGEPDTNAASRPRPEVFAALDAVSSAPSLEAARRQLLVLGFKPLVR